MSSLSQFPRRVLQRTQSRCDSFSWTSKSTGSRVIVQTRSLYEALTLGDQTPYSRSFSSVPWPNDYWRSSRRIADIKRDFSQYAYQPPTPPAPLSEPQKNLGRPKVTKEQIAIGRKERWEEKQKGPAPLSERQNNPVVINLKTGRPKVTRDQVVHWHKFRRETQQKRQLSTSSSSSSDTQQWWSHRFYKNQDGKDITVHYCPSLAITEEVAQLFVNEPVLGFDMEWQMAATTYSSIQDNISAIQLASRDRIAIFHIARFSPNLKLDDLVSPTLKRIIEDDKILKCGVAIKGDCTRLRKFMGIDACGTFELSHLHKLITYCYTNPKLINKYRLKLTELAEIHLGLPLSKDTDVRCSDWSGALTTKQAHYAAADAFAGYMLFVTMDAKRKALDPVPPLPEFDELNLPIRIEAKESKPEAKSKRRR
ncbi:ribonuclease H-like domain-containing protein [Aspergillus filifer]